MHIAGGNVGIIGRQDPSATAPELGEPTEKDAIMQAVSDSFDFGSEIMRGKSNAWATEVVEGPGFLGQSTRARLAYRALAHTWSEYGVTTVYLRLNGLVPPASQ